MLISRQATDDFLARRLDSFLWMKSLSAQQLHGELCRMRVQPYFKTPPWLHQLVCFAIGVHRPEFLFLLDMGAGKSKIILDLITQAQREKRLKRALIGVPRVINMSSWTDDIAKHSDLGAWPINCEDIEEKWERIAEPDGDVSIIDYQGLHWALCKRVGGKGKSARKLEPDEKRIAHVQKLYNFIALDESHKLANHESLWFQLFRRLTKTAEFTYATTGTLFGKKVEMAWPQFYLVDGGETFGPNLGLFRSSFFTAKPNPWGRGEKFEYRPGMDATLNRMMQHRSIRYDESEFSDLPPRVSIVEQYDMGIEQREHYMRALEGLINAGGNIEELDGAWVKMRRIAAGYLTWKDEHGDHVLPFKHNPKLDGLEALLDGMGDRAKAIVAYDYTETGRMLCERVAKMGIGYEWFWGGAKDKEGIRHRFMTDPKCRVLVMNSEAGGTGNDGLQVARYMFLYETPTPPITRKQIIKRIHRPGTTMRTYIYDMVMRKSLEPGILADHAEARDSHDSIVNGNRRPGRGFFLKDWDVDRAAPG